MRRLNSHLSSGGFNQLQIAAVDHPAPGHANGRYVISGFNTAYNPSAADPHSGFPAQFTSLPIIFQDEYARPDAPPNGVTEEALLAVVADHLHGKQLGPNNCMENQMALDYILAAIGMLQAAEMANRADFGFSQQPAYSMAV